MINPSNTIIHCGKQICIFATYNRFIIGNKNKVINPRSGRNGVILIKRKKTRTDVGILFCCIFSCCTRKQKQFSSSISILMICTTVVLVVVSIVVVAMTIIFRDPELYMCHFVYLAKDLFICCINPYTHLHYNPTVSHYFSFISKAHVSVQKGFWKVLTLSTKLVFRSISMF